jgi:hypothetical protein
MNINDWLKEVEPYYLTINDIENMKPGEMNKFLCIDRNFYELIPTITEENAINIEEFVKKCYIFVYKHSSDMNGYINSDIFEIEEEFEFHIEYLPNYWYPLKNGKLPEEDPQRMFKILSNPDIKRHWQEYDKNTRIGWRGPMIPWNIVCSNNWTKIYNPE